MERRGLDNLLIFPGILLGLTRGGVGDLKYLLADGECLDALIVVVGAKKGSRPEGNHENIRWTLLLRQLEVVAHLAAHLGRDGTDGPILEAGVENLTLGLAHLKKM